MFKKNKNTPTEGKNIRAFLEQGCEFEGTFTFTGEVRLNGKLKGKIITEDYLIIGETAEIEGDIQAGTLVIAGKVTGSIKTTQRTEILATASIQGTIETPLLSVQEGAQIQGKICVTPHATQKNV